MYFKINILSVIYISIILSFFISCVNQDDFSIPNDEVYISIPDNYFETELIKQGIDSDGVVNQKLLKKDAEAVTRLDLNASSHFGEIKDLSGVEGFINARFLSAGGQKLKKVDLSYNTLLDTLYLSANLLSNINLSNNVNLSYVDLKSNEFDSENSIIGLSELRNLKDLDVSWNYLKEFSVHNKTLEVLHISHNDLKLINTNGAEKLKNILLSSNKIETVDFSTNSSLETLLISGNHIQNINLNHNLNLTHLYISSNSLSSLDISNNQKLTDLKVDRNPSLTCIKIQKNQNIPIVSIADNQKLSVNCN
jgi:Leucine-rich repeat (LRR) protein